LQCLKSAKLRIISICDYNLTMGEMDELISLVRQRRIFQNVVHIEWFVSKISPILVNKEQCELLLNMIKVVYPQIETVIKGKITYFCCIICYLQLRKFYCVLCCFSLNAQT